MAGGALSVRASRASGLNDFLEDFPIMHKFRHTLWTLPLGTALTIFSLAACSSYPPMPPVAQVDLDRFMGDWYVIAAIPSWPERNAYNAVESYARLPDGKIQTTFRYRDDGFDGKLKTMRPVGTVQADSGNAIWGMQFIWPIKAEYVVTYLDSDYRTVIIGRSKRDYVWIMSRTPVLADQDYDRLKARVGALGYATKALRRVPQQW
jgi:apolipoprotein D and lipocalin family protein